MDVLIQDEEQNEEEEIKSVLAAKLDLLAMNIGKLGGGVAVFCLVVMIIVHVAHGGGSDGEWSEEDPREILDYVITAITILVRI